MAIPILQFWEDYFSNPDEGLGSTYERFIINDVLMKTVHHFRIQSVLETPSFGFTGLSGINSLALALKGLHVTINDTDQRRLEMTKKVWENYDVDVRFDLINDFSFLPYEDNSVDMSWNFSALWFVKDINLFLSELSRISRKVILLMVPNRSGLGYLFQKYIASENLDLHLVEEYIKPESFVKPLQKKGWKLMHDSLIDCPLWPDIGMKKEDLFNKIRLCETEAIVKKTKPLTILNFYNGEDPDMRDRMLRLNFFEKHAPILFKRLWAHHRYYLFLKI